MSTYVIGDIQGCNDALQQLLDKLQFNPQQDTLWLAGDLINRGPDSVAVLRFAKSLGDRCKTILGNHDLHTLAVAKTDARPRRPDTMDELLAAPDCDELMDWLRKQPLALYSKELDFLMVHAGVYPSWDLQTTLDCAAEVQNMLRSDCYVDFLNVMYGSEPDQWSGSLTGMDRLRFITNCFTRMRYCYPDGHLDFAEKGPPGSQPEPLKPWFDIKRNSSLNTRIVFGHWSTLTSADQPHIFAIDTGCLWGGELTALQIDCDPPKRITVDCQQTRKPDSG